MRRRIHRRDRYTVGGRTALVIVVATALAACADTDPTSEAPSLAIEAPEQPGATVDVDVDADGRDANHAETRAGAGVGTEPAVSEPSVTSDVEPQMSPLDERPGGDDTAPSDDDAAADDAGEPDATGSGLATDDPIFDAEPLLPFEVQVAENAPPSGPGLDDAGSALSTGWGAFDAHLDAALLRNGNTAASVAVSIGGDVVHARGFGVRAPSLSDDITDTDDRFRIASISKTITAITLLQLVEDGVVGLDEDVGQLIADQLGVASSAGARGLTPRRLLNHTTGFGKYDTQFFRKGAEDCNDAARIGIRRGPGGGGYTYSNMNYCIAGVLIEALTGTTYTAAAYQYLLTPLGLSGMRLANTYDPGPQEVLHATTIGRNYMETLGAAGSWIATPSDLVTILDSLDHSTPGFKPLEPETVDEMATPTGGRLGQRGYGLGLISYGDGRYGHTGTIESTHAMLLDRGDGVIWAITVAGPYPDSPRLESIINRAFEAAGFISG